MDLKSIYVLLVPRQPCVEKLRRTRLGHHFNLHSSFICAGEIINNKFIIISFLKYRIPVFTEKYQTYEMFVNGFYFGIGGELGKDTCKGIVFLYLS